MSPTRSRKGLNKSIDYLATAQRRSPSQRAL
nr:MAG TPA: hypothetical protein [Caudoviricetes sp.]